MSSPAGKKAAAPATQTNRLSLIVAGLVGIIGLLLTAQGTNVLSYGTLLNDSGEPNLIDVLDASKSITYRGVRRNAVEHFQNIFYAQNPSGKRRFAPPVPLLSAKGAIIDATREGAWCPQFEGPVLPFTSVVVNTSENCLSLRIARPADTKSNAKLPVVVWLHGGGHALGSASDILYTPDGFVQQSVSNGEPTIFVGMNYRLGVFGFATSKALMKAKHTNAGLRDQRLGFEWVKKNIIAFGGDPSRVTAMGQSVGGSDIGLQLTAFGGKGGVPFNKAIMLSGAPGLNFKTRPEEVAARTALVAELVGCSRDDDGQGKKTLACLRDAPWEIIANTSVNMMRGARPPFGEAFFHPTSDNDFLPGFPSELMRSGRFVKDVPLIASWVQNEGAWYQLPTISNDVEVIGSISLWANGLKEDSLAELLALYPLSDFEHLAPEGSPISAQYFRSARINRDLWYTCPAIDFSWQYARISGADLVRLYEFNQTRMQPVWENMGVPFWGASHLSDIPYVLNVQELPAGIDNSPAQLKLAQEISSQVIAFANAKDKQASGTGTALAGWRPSYSSHTKDALKKEHPDSISFNLFGGPYGGDIISVSRTMTAKDDRESAVAAEKLFVRCDFINSEKIRNELGV